MVIFDGERICVQLNRMNWKDIVEIAEQSQYSEYLSDVGIYCLPPTKKIARKLKELNYSLFHNLGFCNFLNLVENSIIRILEFF